jgi:three-Cys-motif partner protein
MKTSFYAEREQTEVKHETLKRYLSAAVPIVGSWAHDITYVDCLAGPWNQVSEALEDTSFHVAVTTLLKARSILAARGKNPSMRCLLVENDPDAFAKLAAYSRTVKGIEVEPREWDFSQRVTDIVSYVRERTQCFPFIFIDPSGWELAAIPLIRPLLELCPGEVLINLMTSWIRRFLDDKTKNFAGLLGANVNRLKLLSGDEQEDDLVRSYADSVRSAGNFLYVCSMPVMKPDQDAFHYHLIYATRHMKGVEEFKKAEKHACTFMHLTRAEAQQRRRLENTGQYSLLRAEEAYKESRFSRYYADNLAKAKDRAESLLKRRHVVSYDEVWAECMQYAAVQDNDLKQWISDWRRQQNLSLLGLAGERAPLRRGTGIQLRWNP